MPCRPRPEAEEELLYAPDAQGEAAATPLDARYYLRWGGGGMGVLAIMRFPMDARHPVVQKPYGAYAVGTFFPLRIRASYIMGASSSAWCRGPMA